MTTASSVPTVATGPDVGRGGPSGGGPSGEIVSVGAAAAEGGAAVGGLAGRDVLALLPLAGEGVAGGEPPSPQAARITRARPRVKTRIRSRSGIGIRPEPRWCCVFINVAG